MTSIPAAARGAVGVGWEVGVVIFRATLDILSQAVFIFLHCIICHRSDLSADSTKKRHENPRCGNLIRFGRINQDARLMSPHVKENFACT